MKTAGIICECNPLHEGHLRLLRAARAAGADCVIGVMSGCFVQRGEAAVADPYARAEILVRAGFDAVFELPFPYSAASAEFFGGAGVEILSRLCVDELWFGSESGDLDALLVAASIADSPAFLEAYAASDATADGTARSYFDLLRLHCASLGLSFSPNDILALSYLRAIRSIGSSLTPRTLRREGSAYRETALLPNVPPSATALRRAWEEGGFSAIRDRLPMACVDVLERETDAGRAPASLTYAERAILSHLRLTPAECLEEMAELGGGLGRRLSHAAMSAVSLLELCSRAATKKYPDARVRRGILFAVLGIRPEELRAPVAYVRLLAAGRTGCDFLSSVRRRATLPILTRKTDLPNTPEAEHRFFIESRERAFYTLCRPSASCGAELLCRTPFILCEENEKNPKK